MLNYFDRVGIFLATQYFQHLNGWLVRLEAIRLAALKEHERVKHDVYVHQISLPNLHLGRDPFYLIEHSPYFQVPNRLVGLACAEGYPYGRKLPYRQAYKHQLLGDTL
ncbi:Uncharacterised protein [Acinetobacter baumannii]|nr:Uncharacterised protein [Acinetobacter baumannii]